MAQQTINIGASPNDGTGTPLRTAFQYTNSNFSELYTAVGPSGNNIVVPGNATITGDLTVDTSTLKVDSANNRVGIGTASPSKPLEVYNTTESTVWANTTTGIALLRAGGTGGDFYFGIDNSTGGGFGQGNYSRLIYSTGAYPIIFSSNASERYRIASDGVATWSNVGGVAGTAMTLNANGLGIGVTPSAWGGSYKALQLQSVARNIAATGAGSGDLTVAFNAIYDSTDSRWEYAGTGDKAGRYSQTGSGNHRWFVSNTAGTAGNEITDFASPAMTLDASGRLLVGPTSANASGGVLQLSSGITFPATQVASSDANTLDDYEEGTWAIGLQFGGASTGITTNSNQGKYTKIGNQVTINGYLALSNKGSSTGNAVITGLPFLANGYTAVSMYMAQITFADVPMGFSNNGTSTIILRESTNAGVSSTLTDADFANNSEIMFNMTYFV